jgi:hypothetical protein
MHSEANEFVQDINNPTDEELERLLTDKIFRLNNLYHIRNKSGKIVRFELNPEQTYYITHRHNRNVNLKARQLGFTTIAVIEGLDDCLFEENFEAGIIADDLDNAIKIFEKAKLAYEKLPDWLKKYREPTTDRAGEYRFPNKSVFSVDTSFRGGTLSRLHVSELGKIAKKWPQKAKEIVTGAFEAVPMDGIIDVESTAEGVTGEFYEICQTAMAKEGRDLSSLEFKFFFFPWYKNPEYQIDANAIIDEKLSEYFKYLETEQGIKLTKQQKNWYALKKESLHEEMAQEYPSFPEEAFLSSGRPVFNQQSIAARIKTVKGINYEHKPFVIKDMEGNEHTVFVKIFRNVVRGKAYAVAGDPAEGLESGDNSALSVLSKDYEQCATYAGKLDPDLFGALLVEIAKYFNNALLAWEQNNHGHAVEAAVRLRKYYNVYRRKSVEKLGEEIKDQVGWLNTAKSKMKMLDDLKEAYRDTSLEINDEDTLREMMTCTIEEDGNIYVNGKDRVVCLGISIQAIPQAVVGGEYKAFVPTKAKTQDVTKMTIEEKIKYYNRMQRQ